MWKMICVHDSSNCLAHADLGVFTLHSSYLVSLRNMPLCLGHAFLMIFFAKTRGRKVLKRHLLQLVRQWFYVMKHYEMGSKCYVMV